MTIKTQSGKVVTKDGKVSCECCGPSACRFFPMAEPDIVGSFDNPGNLYTTAIEVSFLKATSIGYENIPFIKFGATPYQSTGYFNFETGIGKFLPTSLINDQDAIAAAPTIQLKANSFYTLIMSGSSSNMLLDLIEDDQFIYNEDGALISETRVYGINFTGVLFTLNSVSVVGYGRDFNADPEKYRVSDSLTQSVVMPAHTTILGIVPGRTSLIFSTLNSFGQNRTNTRRFGEE